MKRYYIKEQTPLAYHKFIWYVSLPLGTLLTFFRFVTTIINMESFSWLYVMDAIYYILSFSLTLGCFIGFFKWKSYAWYFMRTYIILTSVFSLYVVIIYSYYSSSMISTVISQWIGFTGYAIINGIYYEKRKPLFFPNMVSDYMVENGFVTYQGTVNEIQGEKPRAKFCYSCGSKLSEDCEFCDQCGVKRE